MEINQCSHANKPTSAFHNDSVDRTRVAFFDDSMAMTNWHLRRCHWGSTAPWAPPSGHCLVQQGPLGGHFPAFLRHWTSWNSESMPSSVRQTETKMSARVNRLILYLHHVDHFNVDFKCSYTLCKTGNDVTRSHSEGWGPRHMEDTIRMTVVNHSIYQYMKIAMLGDGELSRW